MLPKNLTITRALALTIFVTLSHAATHKQPITLDDIAPPPGGVSGSIVWAPSEDRFVTTGQGTLALYDVKSRKQRTILPLTKLDSAAAKPTAPDTQTTDWTNRRVTEHSVQWFTDNRRLLVLEAGDLFIVDSDKGTFDVLLPTPENVRDPKLSPDNHYASFRRGHDLYVVDTKTKVVTPLTTDGTETLLNGEPDWVYPEELDLSTAHWWSPDSRSIAYLQFDISREPVFPQVSLLNARGVMEPERYPNAGDPNAEVKLGVISVNGGATKWMNLGSAADNLLARVVWSPNSREVLAERLNRVQNQLDLLLANIETGMSRTVLHEQDKFWINVRNDPQFLATGDRFLWTSERSGYRHLYICGTDGKPCAQLTSGDWEVDKIIGVDERSQRVFFTSTEASPVERQVCSISFDGSSKQTLTSDAGTHAVSFSADFAYYVDDFSNLATPLRSVLHSSDGREIAVYRDSDHGASEKYDFQPVEPINLKTSDGVLLFAHLIKPAGFDPGKKYPAIVITYGGPDEQTVTNSWKGISWEQVLAQEGFVIWQMDNRGSTGRGHAFESGIYHNLGAQELADQKEGIRYLISLGFVDARRIGMTGWSYGGYMTLYTATHAPGLIRAGIAGGPVSDWRNYDSIYTERYMGLPEENPAGYRTSSPVESASGIDGTALLILHNIEDDNVHFQNSLQMANALEMAGKNFFMVVYPGRMHNVTDAPRRQMLAETTKFFEDNLR
jgi:dipeptidyl-peptidase-4